MALDTARAERDWQLAEREWFAFHGASIADTLRLLVQRSLADPSDKVADDQLIIALWRARRLTQQLGVADRLTKLLHEVTTP